MKQLKTTLRLSIGLIILVIAVFNTYPEKWNQDFDGIAQSQVYETLGQPDSIDGCCDSQLSAWKISFQVFNIPLFCHHLEIGFGHGHDVNIEASAFSREHIFVILGVSFGGQHMPGKHRKITCETVTPQ